MTKNTKVKTKVKKEINDSPEVIVNIAKMLEQSPKPEATELRTNNCTLDIILFLNLHLSVHLNLFFAPTEECKVILTTIWNTHRPEGAVILDTSSGLAGKPVLQSLCVRLESWRFPIPTWSIFLAAFSSLSWVLPQFKQVTVLTFSSNLPHLKPQSEQIWLVGSHLLTVLKVLPNFSDFASHNSLNSRQPSVAGIEKVSVGYVQVSQKLLQRHRRNIF